MEYLRQAIERAVSTGAVIDEWFHSGPTFLTRSTAMGSMGKMGLTGSENL